MAALYPQLAQLRLRLDLALAPHHGADLERAEIAETTALFPRRHLLLALGLLIALAAFLRFYSLDAVPPGLFHDEAVKGEAALRVLRGEYRIFFETNDGREPLFIYLLTLPIVFLGNTPFALRFTAAVVGIITVVAVYLMAAELAPRGGDRRYLGLLCAAVTAGLYWHVAFSRLGFRAILVPLVVALQLFFLWRAMRSGRPWAYGWAGLITAFGWYTETAAWGLGVVLVLVGAFVLWRRPQARKEHLRGLALALGVYALISSPLWVYFATNPIQLWWHPYEVSLLAQVQEEGAALPVLVRKVLGTFQMFFISGDADWKWNLPGKPILGPPLAVALLLGVVATVRRRAAEGVAILLAAGMLSLPSLLSADDGPQGTPNSMRTLALVPLLCYWAGAGMHWAFSWTLDLIRSQIGWRRSLSGLWLGLLLVAGAQGADTYHTYFGLWAPRAEAYVEMESDTAAVGTFLAHHPALAPGEPVAVSELWEDRRIILAFLAPQAIPRARWFDGGQYLPLGSGWHVFRQGVRPPEDAMRPLRGLAQERVAGSPTPGGGPSFEALRLDLPQPAELEARLGENVRLKGAWLPQVAQAGAELVVLLFWDASVIQRDNPEILLYLLDREDRQWGERHFPLPGPRGDLAPASVSAVVTWHGVPIPTNAAPGDYQLSLGARDPASGQELNLTTAQGQQVRRLTLGSVRVEQ